LTYSAVLEFQKRYFVDGIADETTQKAIERASIVWRLSGHPIFPVPDGLAEVQATYGEVVTRPDPTPKWGFDAWVKISNDWEENYLVTANLPIVGDQKINKVIEPSLRTVFDTIKDRGLDQEIKQFGCFAPRHKMHNRNNGLSIHTWAAAVDINWATNGVGTKGDLDPGIVQAFTEFGWIWGGNWRMSDPMHFQLCTGV
jgi:hypothetical protein